MPVSTQASASAGSSTSSATGPVTISAQPASVTTVVGGDAVFTVTASATSALNYQWLRDGVPIAGATALSLVVKAVKAADNGAKFSVIVKTGDANATLVTSAQATLTVNTAAATAYPILFVTSVPGVGFQHQLNTFGNHGNSAVDAVAGGDLYLRYPDGTLRNLTKEAGWGVDSGGIQGGPKAISVRQPSMHWDGKKALFSMMVGGPSARYQLPVRNWQMFEVSGLGKGEKAVITKVAGQPAAYNNISPIYGSDDQILFVSDAPLFGMSNTYPQLDEYEATHTNTGVWKLNVSTGKVSHLEHAPSGVFDLFLDSFGRIIFTKWDHLKRDQEADIDRYLNGGYGSIDYESETSNQVKTYPARDAKGKLIADPRGVLYDVFPEARHAQDPTRDPNEALHDYNQFFVWQMNEDGSEEETINHVGRHEFGGGYMVGVFLNDPNLTDVMPSYIANVAMRGTMRGDAGMFQMREDINRPGSYLGTYSQEFARQASGRIVEFKMPPGTNPEDVVVTDHTNATLDADPYGAQPALSTMTGHYRSPLRLSDGSILVSHTPEYRMNAGDRLYRFQLKKLIPNPLGKDMIAGPSLTGGIAKNILYWTDDAAPRQYNGLLNEHDAVEVRARVRPVSRKMSVAAVEKKVLSDEGVNEAELRAWLQSKNLALIVSRNVTARDRADVNQPFNLRVPGGVQNIPKPGIVYDISGLQIFQGDLTRGYGKGQRPGRRVYARPVHNNTTHTDVESWYPTGTQPATVQIGKDGSTAALVPAGRALSWQLTSPTGKPVVRERVWVSFAPGEIRTCVGCHGVNKQTLNGLTEPQNPPEALRELVRTWKARK
ncbi:MAG: hypothetical protein EOP38_05845 [Rubrivivax sp.]|nr:MAG: hypothetical protein EOP38_05845 [Rubrivivax sp.]